MTSGMMLRIISNYAVTYVKDAGESITRNRHMNDLKGKKVDQKVIDAVVVDFINFMGAQCGVDWAMNTSDLADEIKPVLGALLTPGSLDDLARRVQEANSLRELQQANQELFNALSERTKKT